MKGYRQNWIVRAFDKQGRPIGTLVHKCIKADTALRKGRQKFPSWYEMDAEPKESEGGEGKRIERR